MLLEGFCKFNKFESKTKIMKVQDLEDDNDNIHKIIRLGKLLNLFVFLKKYKKLIAVAVVTLAIVSAIAHAAFTFAGIEQSLFIKILGVSPFVPIIIVISLWTWGPNLNNFVLRVGVPKMFIETHFPNLPLTPPRKIVKVGYHDKSKFYVKGNEKKTKGEYEYMYIFRLRNSYLLLFKRNYGREMTTSLPINHMVYECEVIEDVKIGKVKANRSNSTKLSLELFGKNMTSNQYDDKYGDYVIYSKYDDTETYKYLLIDDKTAMQSHIEKCTSTTF